MPGDRATVITDASWCPETCAGGWAAWIVLSDTSERLKRHGRFQSFAPSSEVAELWAAINGTALAYQAGMRRLLVQTDCLWVVQKARFDETFIGARKSYFPDAVIQFRHVKGHTKNSAPRSWVNRWCDKHAKMHMREMRNEGPASPTLP